LCSVFCSCNGLPDDGLDCGDLIVVQNTYYDGSTTDFTAVSDFSDVSEIVLEKTDFGKIEFLENVNIPYSISVDPPFTEVSEGIAFINTTLFPFLNVSANITLKVELENPIVLRDGEPCSSDICSFKQYVPQNNEFLLTVEHFSEYRIKGRCSDDTYYKTCVEDSEPSYCDDNGDIVNNCAQCGCPSGKTCSNSQCIPTGGDDPPGGGNVCDEDDQPRACGKTTGICEPGTQSCVNGQWGACVGGVAEETEICDRLDNDCDGSTDEGLSCSCHIAPTLDTRECGSDIGVCSPGVSSCKSNGLWGACINAKGPEENSERKCTDNKDNDCDGYTDELDDDCTGSDIKGSSCTNGKQDSNEDGVDCGGACMNDCPDFPYMGLILIGLILLLVSVVMYLKETNPALFGSPAKHSRK